MLWQEKYAYIPKFWHLPEMQATPLSLVQWYFDTIQPRTFWLEKPLDLYTDRELEYINLRARTAVLALTQPKERALSTPETYLQSAHLLPGGRWLLFGARDGSVKYYDLNSLGEISEAVILVPSHFEQGANTLVRLPVEMDYDAAYLTFNLGVMNWRLPPLDDLIMLVGLKSAD